MERKTRDFTRVLRCFKPFWQELETNPKNHAARGLVIAQDGTAHIIELSTDDTVKRIWLTVRLSANNGLNQSQLLSLLEMQYQTTCLYQISYNREHSMILLRSCTVLPNALFCGCVVPQLFYELKELLDGGGLDHLLN